MKLVLNTFWWLVIGVVILVVILRGIREDRKKRFVQEARERDAEARRIQDLSKPQSSVAADPSLRREVWRTIASSISPGPHRDCLLGLGTEDAVANVLLSLIHNPSNPGESGIVDRREIAVELDEFATKGNRPAIRFLSAYAKGEIDLTDLQIPPGSDLDRLLRAFGGKSTKQT